MAHYKFVTSWKLNAPLVSVWNVIMDIPEWHNWWQGVLEVRVVNKSQDGIAGMKFAHTWRSIIPYKLKFETEIIEVLPMQSIKAFASGELEGTGQWDFTEEGNGITKVTYFWFVQTNRTWMNISAPVLSGIFRWNHDAVMRWGGQGLAKKLNCRFTFESECIH